MISLVAQTSYILDVMVGTIYSSSFHWRKCLFCLAVTNYGKAIFQFLILIFAFMIAYKSVVNFGILGMATYQAWKARHLSSEFQETKHLFRILATMVIILFIGLPVTLLGMGNQDVELFMISSAIFVTAMSVQVLLFFPKFRYIHTHESKRSNNIQITGVSTSSEEENNKSSKGEAIWSVKSRRQLVKEVSALRRRLREGNGEGGESPKENGMNNNEQPIPKDEECVESNGEHVDDVNDDNV